MNTANPDPYRLAPTDIADPPQGLVPILRRIGPGKFHAIAGMIQFTFVGAEDEGARRNGISGTECRQLGRVRRIEAHHHKKAIGGHLETKIGAFKAHTSQQPLWPLFEQYARKRGSREMFHLAAAIKPEFAQETDLFAGVSDEEKA